MLFPILRWLHSRKTELPLPALPPSPHFRTIPRKEQSTEPLTGAAAAPQIHFRPPMPASLLQVGLLLNNRGSRGEDGLNSRWWRSPSRIDCQARRGYSRDPRVCSEQLSLPVFLFYSRTLEPGPEPCLRVSSWQHLRRHIDSRVLRGSGGLETDALRIPPHPSGKKKRNPTWASRCGRSWNPSPQSDAGQPSSAREQTKK